MRRKSCLTGLAALGLTGGLIPMLTTPAGAATRATTIHAASGTPTPTVVATGLDNPRHLSVGPDGALYVAEAGIGDPTQKNCIPATDEMGNSTQDCLGDTGAIAKVTASGVTPVLSGLESVITEPAGHSGPEVAGPSAVVWSGGMLHVTMQDTDLNSNGTNKFEPGSGTTLGKLVTAAPNSAMSSWTLGPDFAAYAATNPQGSSTLGPSPQESATDSDPYGILPYQGGYAVVDAAANALRFVSATGAISTLATFPTQTYTDGTVSQAVPTNVVVGPDGALYVSELVGVPAGSGGPTASKPNSAMVYRVVPGQAPTVYASGFNAITDLAFDTAGRLYVVEYNSTGLANPPSGGELIRYANGTQTVMLSGLTNPTGVAVTDSAVYVSNVGSSSSTTAGDGSIVKVPFTADGYRMVAADAGMFDFGQYQFFGSLGNQHINKPVVGFANDPTGPGYWMVASDGGIFNFGAAGFYGSMGGTTLNKPIVAMAATPDGRGYWMVASDGGIFNFGDATFYGSMGGKTLNKPIVGMAATRDGGGYWLVASDGGIFAFGDATFYGSEGGATLNQPIVGIAASVFGHGYRMVASDGGIFDFGDATYYGSEGDKPLNKPIVGIATAPDGGGYWLVGSDGGIFAFGDANFFGSEGGTTLNQPIVAIGA